MKQKALSRMHELQLQNLKHYIRIIDDFMFRIRKQKCGCNVKDHGAAYYNNFDKTFDPFGLCLGFEAIRTHFGQISDDEQRPLVRKMSRRFRVNCETDKEYSSFVAFLQQLQDIHDFSFDQYYKVEGDRMENYMHQMVALRDKIRRDMDV